MRFARTLSLSLKLAYKRGVASIFVPPTPTRFPLLSLRNCGGGGTLHTDGTTKTF